VQDSVYDAFAEAQQGGRGAVFGNGAAPGIDRPLINAAAVKKVESLIADGVKRRVGTLGGIGTAPGGTFSSRPSSAMRRRR
jgi:acyl-CoA reductase-like NAD-dependent aldehyde dehydrogenase